MMDKIKAELSEESEGDLQSRTEETSEEVLLATLDLGEVTVELYEVDGGEETDERGVTNHGANDTPGVTIYDVQIKSEPDSGNDNECDKELKAPGDLTKEVLESTIDLSKVKIEPEEESEQPASTKADEMIAEPDTKNLNASEANHQKVNKASSVEPLESTIDIGEVKIESEVETETVCDDDSSEQSVTSNQKGTTGLQQCTKCGRTFETVGYKIHIKICDGTIPDRIFKCPHCPITFPQRFRLTAHVNKHTGKTPYPCRKHCKIGFASSEARNRHEFRCGEVFHKCTLCDKVLANQFRLFDHYTLEHPGEQRFPCSMCERRFYKKAHLQRHERMHTPGDLPKPFTCSVCGKSCTEKFNLKKHMAIHTERKPIQCEHCDKQFKLQISLELHKAGKHPDVATESAKRNLARSKERSREVFSKRKLEPRELKKRERKPKKKMKELEPEIEAETESSEDDSDEESDTE